MSALLYIYDPAGIFLYTDLFEYCNCVPYFHFLFTCMYDEFRYTWKIFGLSLLILKCFKTSKVHSDFFNYKTALICDWSRSQPMSCQLLYYVSSAVNYCFYFMYFTVLLLIIFIIIIPMIVNIITIIIIFLLFFVSFK